MKKIFIILLGLVASLYISAQTTEEVIQKVQQIVQENGDSIARDYLIKNQSVFINEDANPIYLAFWGLLTSNMWNANPTEALQREYREYLDATINDDIKSEDFLPDRESLSALWQLTSDYYKMLYQEENKDESLHLLKCIHRWFEPYPDLRNTEGYAQSLFDLCTLLVIIMHKNTEGEGYIKEYVDLSKSMFGDNSAQYAVALYYLCLIPDKTAEEKAQILKKAISIYEATENHGSNMLELMKSLYNAQVSYTTGIFDTSQINTSPDNILSLLECETLVAVERGAEALPSLLYYKNQYSQEQRLDTISYALVIHNIINTYIQFNDLAKAQKELEDFNSRIGVDNIPQNHAINFYTSAGLIAFRLKDYPKALSYAHSACRLSEKIESSAIEYCKLLGNLGIMYATAAQDLNDNEYYLDAKWYIDEAMSIFEEKIGPPINHGSTGLLLLNSKAMVYEAIGDHEAAIEVFEQIVSGFSENKDVQGAWILAANNLAVSYLKTEQPEKAIKLLESLSSKNEEYNMLFKQNLAFAYYVSGSSKLKNTLRDYNSICYNNCLDVFNFFTEAEREEFWTRNSRELLAINNLATEKYPEIADVAFDNLLFVKNLKLMSADILKSMVENSSDEELKKKYKKVLLLRDAIAYRSSEQDSIRLWNSQLKEEERTILGLVPDYKQRLLSSFHTWTEIRNALKEDEIAIDFTYVPKMKGWGDADGYYGAFVLTKDSRSPLLISLCEVDTINNYVTGLTTDAQQISNFYKESSSIYKRIWGKLEEYIKDKKTIYFAPTGQLNLLNHDALVRPDGKLFGDSYNLVRLSSTDKILSNISKETKLNQDQSAVIYGGILYDLSVAQMNEAAKKYRHPSGENNYLAMRSEDERGRWNYLQGTEYESQDVYNLLTSNNVTATLLQGAVANEESFKALSGHSPSIIHLSTHGFFLESKEKEKANPFMNSVGNYSEKEDKMIRTGLLMAGANNVWCGKNQITGIEDGILTADEISRLDLRGTKLVVLSACETAKGQIDEIDGVLGLQRGLKKAGAETIIMSLWKVSDSVTSILMTQFYTNLGKGKTPRESLREASRKVKEEYPDPYYWACFIMLD